MKQYTFKDGTKVIAGSVEEAKAKHKVMASNNIKNLNEYKSKFDEYWLPKIDFFKKNADKLKYIEYNIWLTDCNEEYSKFAEWGFDNDISVKKVPISVDWWLKSSQIHNNDIRNALEILTEEKLYEERYDKEYASSYWRNENINTEGFNTTLKSMKEADKFIEDVLKMVKS